MLRKVVFLIALISLTFGEVSERKLLEYKYWCLKLKESIGCLKAGEIYEKKGDKDYAIFYYEQGCNLKSGASCYKLALLLIKGEKTETEGAGYDYMLYACKKMHYGKACYWLSKKHEKDNPEKALKFARIGCTYSPSDEVCFAYYRLSYRVKCERKKDPKACFLASFNYEKQIGKLDFAKEFRDKYAKLSCEYGYPKACWKLCKYTNNVSYCERACKISRKVETYCEPLCESGNGYGCYRLGMYYEKSFFSSERSKAIAYFKKACSSGYKPACKKVQAYKKKEEERERMYRAFMEKIRKRRERLRRMERECYETENPNVCYKVAEQYLRDKRFSSAVKPLEIACKKDNDKACAYLGLLYMRGAGVQMNKFKAYELLIKSAKKGNVLAQNLLDELCKESPWSCK